MRLRFLLASVVLSSLVPLSVEARRPTLLAPRIVPRTEWGADEALGIATEQPIATPAPVNGAEPAPAGPVLPPERVRLCQEAMRNFSQEFRIDRTDMRDRESHPYVWPRAYSPKVRLIVLHHTGEDDGEEREKLTGTEHVRAIYEWHTVHNGWGDIGYHYLIDADGVIYEGRAGGNSVIGAHAYCANTGTMGIALLGNFLHRYPSEAQLKSVRWLLAKLTEEYRIRPLAETSFHGKRVPTIAMHKDLNDTECPGLIDRLIPMIRSFVARTDFTTPILPLAPPLPEREKPIVTANLLAPIGSTKLRLPPRGTGKLTLRYAAMEKAVSAGERIAPVTRSDSGIGLWQGERGERKRVRDHLTAEGAMERGEERTITLTILAPPDAGIFTLEVDGVTITLEVGGRRAR